ncbi:MAG: type II toxin-antitoxin system RelE/ParE family toxin [Bacteroidales bacterium]|nr:type II toxin-antitoxin system RelE/ParE family toxin [Bacteroidales bacterium]
MVGKKTEIIFKDQASRSITEIRIYISEQGFPDFANQFMIELFNFGFALKNFPKKYPLCRKPILFRKEFRCAVFKKKYIFIYKLHRNKVVIYNVIHSNRYIY